MSDINNTPAKKWFDTASISATHRRLVAEGHNVSETLSEAGYGRAFYLLPGLAKPA